MRRMTSVWSLILAASLQMRGAASFGQGAPAASPVIVLLRDAPDARTRAQAALTLGRLRPRGACEALEQGLADPSPAVRAACAATLGDLGEPDSVHALRARSRDDDADVREAVARALARIAPPPSEAVAAAPDPSSVDYSSVRFILRPGELADRAGQDPARVEMVRSAVFGALSSRETVAALADAPPRAALQRVRRGAIRQFNLEGGLQRLQRAQLPDGDTLRAEVSLVIVSDRNRAILGMLSGSAVIRVPASADASSLRRYESSVIQAAVRGALRDVESALAMIPR